MARLEMAFFGSSPDVCFSAGFFTMLSDHRLVLSRSVLECYVQTNIEIDVTHCIVAVIGLRSCIRVSSYNIRSEPHLISAAILSLVAQVMH